MKVLPHQYQMSGSAPVHKTLVGTLSLTLIYCYSMLNPFESPCNNFFVVLMTNHVTNFEPKMLYLFNFFEFR